MSEHTIESQWLRRVHQADPTTYSRNHVLFVGGGQRIGMSAAKAYKGDSAMADPEQLFVGAVSSCHMLFFLAIAEAQGYEVETYSDKATGYLEKINPSGLAVSRIVLAPEVTFTGRKRPDAATVELIHERAHEACFIAKSIKSTVLVQPPSDLA